MKKAKSRSGRIAIRPKIVKAARRSVTGRRVGTLPPPSSLSLPPSWLCLRERERQRDQRVDILEIEGLRHIRERPALERFGGVAIVHRPGDHDHADAGVDPMNLPEHLEARHAGHVVIEQDEIRAVTLDQLESLESI